MKTQMIRLAWQYGLEITIKKPQQITINHTNGKEMAIVEKDNLLILKINNNKKEIGSLQAFEKKVRSHFHVQEKNKFITLSDKQINDELLDSTFSNLVVSVVNPLKLSCVTLVIEEPFNYSRYKRLKYTVLEHNASAQIKHNSTHTEIAIVGEKEKINQIIRKENLTDKNLNWNNLQKPIIFGVSIKDEEKYLKAKTADRRKTTKELENEIKDLEEVYQDQLNSFSWKVTKPLRMLTGMVKKIIHR